MSVSSKKEHHINQLLSTAAAGAGIVGDVDALLTPIQMTLQQRQEPKTERNLWREEEMLQMLKLMLQANAIEMLNDKSVKSEKVFQNIEKSMFECGYRRKSYMQIWTKWKFLKSTYTTSRRAGVIPRMIPPSIYHILHTILGNAPISSNGSANSNGGTGGGSSVDGDNSDSSRLIISHVESGCVTNGSGKRSKRHNNSGATISTNEEAEEANGFDMAHPIFGFRLGTVKQEPADTGYEGSQINDVASEQDPLDHADVNSPDSSAAHSDLTPEIKQEIEETSPGKQQEEQDEEEDRQLVIRCTPSKGFGSMTSENSLPPRDKRMPPLRIAPFAKTPQINFQKEQQQQLHSRDCSPPPLSIHSVSAHEQPQQATHRHFTRQSQGQNNAANINTGNVRMQHRLWMQKQIASDNRDRVIPTTPTGAPIRLPRDITIHQTRPSTTATDHRAKQAFARHSNYDLRHDETVLPDIEADETALQQQQSQCYATNFTHRTGHGSVSQQTSPSGTSTPTIFNQRKRRLQLPYTETRPVKVVRTFTPLERMDSYQDNEMHHHQIRNEEYASGAPPSMTSTSCKLNQQRIKLQQKYLKQQQIQQQQRKAQRKRDEDCFDAALKDLSKSIRTTQRQIIADFFEKQMQITREEHDFQARQDKLLMKAFGEQTQLLLESAKNMFGIELMGQSNSEAKRDSTKVDGQQKDDIPMEETHKRNGNEDTSSQDFVENQDSADEQEEETEGVRLQEYCPRENNEYNQEEESFNGTQESNEDDDQQQNCSDLIEN